MLRRRPDLPRHMAGGPVDNPLGARAMYLWLDAVPHSRLERAGDDRPGGVVGLLPHDHDDVTDLYGRVSVGTTVVVKN